MLLIADYIVPGHGPMFSVTAVAREEANKKSTLSTGQVNYLPPSFVKSGFSLPAFPIYSDSLYGTKWVDDVATKVEKFDLIGSSRLSPRCWEDKLRDSDLSRRDFNKPDSSWSCKPDLFGGQSHLDTKPLYDSGSRSLDARINFEDRARSPIPRDSRAHNLDDYSGQVPKKFTSDTSLYSGSSSSILKSKVEREVERVPIGSSLRTFDSSKPSGAADSYSVVGHAFSDFKTDHKYGLGKELSYRDNDKTGLKVSFDPLSKSESKDKLIASDKSCHSLPFGQTYGSDIRKADERFTHEEKVDPFKLKHDLSAFNSVDKFRDEVKSDKFKWDSRDSTVRDWGSLDRHRAPTGDPLLSDVKGKDVGDARIPIFSDLKATTAHSSADSLIPRDDRFSRVII